MLDLDSTCFGDLIIHASIDPVIDSGDSNEDGGLQRPNVINEPLHVPGVVPYGSSIRQHLLLNHPICRGGTPLATLAYHWLLASLERLA